MKCPRLVIPFLFLFAARGIFSLDFGALISGQYSAEGREETEHNGRAVLAPWFSLPLGTAADLYGSAGLTVRYRDSGAGKSDTESPLTVIPELFRLEASYRFPSLVSVKAGRIAWEDPTGFTARGRFDGMSVSADLDAALLGAGIYYTGLLYKDTANINITPGDPVNYDAPLDYAHFADTYFAPRRLLAAVEGEFPGLFTRRGTLHAGLLGQFDFSGAPAPLHSQYLLLRYTLGFSGGFDAALAGAAELAECNGDINGAFAASFEAGWMPAPTPFNDRLSFMVRWASDAGSAQAAYFPLIKESQGRVFKPDFSGIMVTGLCYEARFLASLSAEITGRYFLRTGSTAFTDPDLKAPSGGSGGNAYFLGSEFSAAVLWVPLSDLSFSLGGGVFLPQTGNALRDDAPVRWSISLGTIFSL